MYIFYSGRDIFSEYKPKEVYRMNDMVYEKFEINDAIAILENIKSSIGLEYFLKIQEIIDIFLESQKNNYNIYILYFNDDEFSSS